MEFKRIIRSTILVIFVFYVTPLVSMSQTYYFERFGAEEGLNSSKVYVALQDSRDYIWLGTGVGVSRYDGAKVENFSVDNGIAPGGVRSMCEDTQGRVWFGHLNGGISYFNGTRFVRASFGDDNIVSDINSIRQQGDFLWITTWRNGAMRVNLPVMGDSILVGEQYHGSEGLSDIVLGSYIDREGNYYCITDIRGIRKYLPAENRFESFSPPGLTREWQFTAMLEDSRGNFWFGTDAGGLYKMVKGSNEAMVFDKRDGLARNWITCLMEDYRGNIWVGTNGEGITVFSGDKMRNFNRSNGLSAMQIFSLMEDKEKNIIITDFADGFSIFKGDHIYTISGTDILAGKAVHSVREARDGKIWLGTNGGITVYDPESGSNQDRVVYNLSTTLANVDQTRFLETDRSGLMWVGTHGQGLFFVNPDDRRFSWMPSINSSIWQEIRADRVVTAMTFDRRGNQWVGTNEGLFLRHADSLRGYKYTMGPGRLAGNAITSLFCDSKGNIWIGSELQNGFTKHVPVADRERGEFTIINLGGDNYIPRVITETPDGRIWVGTGSGLIVLKNDSIDTKITDKDGLLSNNISQLLPDGNFMYIGTNRGLNRLNLNDSTIATFTRRNGFTGIEATPNGSFKDSKGRLWFGTTNGVTVIDPSKYPPVNTRPMTHLGGMLVDRKPRTMDEGLKLGYREREISFDYYSVCLANPDAVSFMVMLEGADQTWRPVTNQTNAYFSALNHGHYSFRVKASNNYGYWDEEPVSYSFIIKPPFWKTSWFIAFMITAAFAVIAVYIKIREMNLIKEKTILEVKVKERTAEVVQKSHIIEEKNRDITASIRYAERIQRAMLPPDNLLKDTFVMFRPKDIVSGDFYWMYDNGECEFIAAVDCTGHGVPGAFMSIIGHNSLNKIVREYGVVQPSAILDQLNNEVVKALLSRHETTINDGMDLSLIAYNRRKRTLQYSGAYNPLYVVRDGEITVYKADRFPIGMSSIERKKTFTNVTVDIVPGDMVYMSSDGFADQFGGPKGSKYMSANFKKFLVGIHNIPVHDQKGKLEAEIMRWKGDLPQVDDILVIGTRIS